jgi:hypothetical protein
LCGYCVLEMRVTFTMDLEPNSASQTASKMDRRSSLPESQDSTMDWKSHQVPSPNHRPTSSIYSDDVSIMTYLIHKVSEETRTQEYETIASFVTLSASPHQNQRLESLLRSQVTRIELTYSGFRCAGYGAVSGSSHRTLESRERQSPYSTR